MDRVRRDKSAAGADLRFLHFNFWDLSDVDFRNANLEGANLSQTDLSRADLRGANIRSAKLLGAKLCGANLDGATLSGALVRGADFSGVRGLTTEQTAVLERQGAKIWNDRAIVEEVPRRRSGDGDKESSGRQARRRSDR